MVRCPKVDESIAEEDIKSLYEDFSGGECSHQTRGGMCPDVPMLESSEEEHKRLGELRDAEVERERRNREERENAELVARMTKNRLLANEKIWKSLKWLVVVFASVWVLSQLLSLISIINSSVGVVRYVALTAVLAIGSVCIWCVFQLYHIFKSLPRIEQSVKTNANRIHNEDGLRRYVESLANVFPLEGSFRKVVSDEAEKCLRDLSEKDFGGVNESWVRRFETLQAEQVRRANELVVGYAKCVGIGTATCPWRAGDVFIVFSNSISLVVDIAKIFNRIDVNRYVAFKFIREWLSQMYIAGQLQDVSDLALSKVGISNGSDPACATGTWIDVLGAFSAPLKKVLGKVSEGAVNGLLCYRFGKMAIKEFVQLRYESEFAKEK